MVRPYLLDVNVLLALAWPSHVHHRDAQQWFALKASPAGFRTCPLTQTSFVRISSNPAFTRRAVRPHSALLLLESVTGLAGHGFWHDDLSVDETISQERPLVGHRQVVDAYLLALAAEHDGVLATLDRGVMALPGADSTLVEIVQGV